MKKNLQIIDYGKLIYKQIKEDHKIGEHVFLLDEYQLSPVKSGRKESAFFFKASGIP